MVTRLPMEFIERTALRYSSCSEPPSMYLQVSPQGTKAATLSNFHLAYHENNRACCQHEQSVDSGYDRRLVNKFHRLAKDSAFVTGDGQLELHNGSAYVTIASTMAADKRRQMWDVARMNLTAAKRQKDKARFFATKADMLGFLKAIDNGNDPQAVKFRSSRGTLQYANADDNNWTSTFVKADWPKGTEFLINSMLLKDVLNCFGWNGDKRIGFSYHNGKLWSLYKDGRAITFYIIATMAKKSKAFR